MFIDWLTVHQDYDQQLPLIGDRACVWFDTVTQQALSSPRTGPIKHEGSYSTSVQIKVSGNRLRIDGNPSRLSRLENLFGFSTIDECIRVYNHMLLSLGLPPLTKCTRVYQGQGDEFAKAHLISDGAVIERIDITTNKAVGQGCEDDYIRAVSGLPYRNMRPHLHPDGKTVDWRTKAGNNRLLYPSMYNKAYELQRHIMPKIKKLCGEDSPEFTYLTRVYEYCRDHGVVRCEQKLHSELLRRERLAFYGLNDMNNLFPLHKEFIGIDSKLQVTSLELENISQRLISTGVVESTHAANITAMYAIHWAHGQQFDLAKSQVKNHRARLRKIGIDIALPCDLTKFSPVYVKHAKEVVVSDLAVPSWYRVAKVPSLRAA